MSPDSQLVLEMAEDQLAIAHKEFVEDTLSGSKNLQDSLAELSNCTHALLAVLRSSQAEFPENLNLIPGAKYQKLPNNDIQTTLPTGESRPATDHEIVAFYLNHPA